MMLFRFRALLVIALVLPLFAQQAPIKKQVDDVVAMQDAGLSDDLIIAKLRKENTPLDLSTDDMIRLKKAKVSDIVIQVMLNPGAEAKPAAQPAAVTPGMLTIGNVRGATASGATPSPGTDAKGDPNDPLSPHDSGIYVMTAGRDGKAQMVVLERASYQGSKSGGFLASAMTYGIVKAKTKAAINGPHADIRVNEPSPVFYFYFDDKQAGLGKTYFGVGNLSNPNQFSLLKLEVTKTSRESTVGSFSALGSSSGADTRAMIQFRSERIRPGLYKVVVEDLKTGEYCFVASSNMGVQTPYSAGASVTTDIFDFGADLDAGR